ncbi:MAG TPA: flagellar motor switch protein FliM [Egibacteraceae bacterium]|nr:flagellar motor switch protein FliM [Egibacteraceae bacterium]
MTAAELPTPLGRAVRPAPLPQPAATVGAAPFDFSRRQRLGRDTVRALQVAHELFARRMASGWGGALRALVQVEPLAVDQVSYDAYIRSMPNPHIVATVCAPGLAGSAVIEMNADLGLVLVDRLLGGRAVPGAHGLPEPRRPTELEAALLADLFGHAAAALDETLGAVSTGPAALAGVEYNPQLVQVAAPSDEVVLLTFRLTLSQGVGAEGLLTVCYPPAFLAPILDQISAGAGGDSAPAAADTAARAAVADRLGDVAVTLQVRLAESPLPARALAGLSVGDVIRLDHRAGRPVRGEVGGFGVVEGHVGRRGRRLALQVARWVDQSTGRTFDPTETLRTAP